jgi:hypothetical protein
LELIICLQVRTQNQSLMLSWLEIMLIYIVYTNFLIQKMVLETLYDEVSSFSIEEEVVSVYKHATSEPHNSLYIDTHPNAHKEKRLRRNFDIVLSIVGH